MVIPILYFPFVQFLLGLNERTGSGTGAGVIGLEIQKHPDGIGAIRVLVVTLWTVRK